MSTAGPMMVRLCERFPWFVTSKVYAPGVKAAVDRVIEYSFWLGYLGARCAEAAGAEMLAALPRAELWPPPLPASSSAVPVPAARTRMILQWKAPIARASDSLTCARSKSAPGREVASQRLTVGTDTGESVQPGRGRGLHPSYRRWRRITGPGWGVTHGLRRAAPPGGRT